jgi:hypothetical protein
MSARATTLLKSAFRTLCQVFRRLSNKWKRQEATLMFCFFCENASEIMNVTI